MITSATIQDRIRKSSVIRFISFPYIILRNRLSYLRYHNNFDIDRLKQLKNTHANDRCFIIGNGPSLTSEDLEKLKDEITFAFNRIYKIYDKTEWRPTYYMITDASIISQFIQDDIPDIGSKISFISNHQLAEYWKSKMNVQEIYVKGANVIHKNAYYVSEISEDVSDYFTAADSVIINALELAFYMRFEKIYLIGVDHRFPIEVDAKGKMRNRNVKAHFEGDSYKGNFISNKDGVTKSFETCKLYAEVSGITIYNATRGGDLEVFERVSLDDLL